MVKSSKRAVKNDDDWMGEEPPATVKVQVSSKVAKKRHAPVIAADENSCSLDAYLSDTTGSKLQQLMQSIVEKRGLSRKQRRKAEQAAAKEAKRQAIANEESHLPPEEQTARERRRELLESARRAQSEISALKRRRAQMGKKTISQREAKRVMAKRIKELKAESMKCRRLAHSTSSTVDVDMS